MRYYPAFDLPGRQRLAPQDPEAARVSAQLLLVQRLDGGLTIGDTHEYTEPFGFDVEEDAYEHLLAVAARLLGTVIPPVRRRWAGVYSQVTGTELYHRSEVAPGVVVTRTGGHTPGHSVVRLASGGDRLMFAGDAVFAVGFEQPGWHNGFEHDPEEAARVRGRLLRELAETGEMLVATHLPFPSIGRVAADGDAFRWVPAFWDY